MAKKSNISWEFLSVDGITVGLVRIDPEGRVKFRPDVTLTELADLRRAQFSSLDEVVAAVRPRLSPELSIPEDEIAENVMALVVEVALTASELNHTSDRERFLEEMRDTFKQSWTESGHPMGDAQGHADEMIEFVRDAIRELEASGSGHV